MSQENVEAAKRTYAVFNDALKSGDMAAPGLVIEERFEPEVVVQVAGVVPESEEMHGYGGAVRFLAAQREAFDATWLEPQEFIGPEIACW